MKKILFIVFYALLFALLSSCQKVDNPFTFTFYTSNSKLPALYVEQGNKCLGKVNFSEHDPGTDVTAFTTHISDTKNVRFVGVDDKGNVVATMKFTLQNDGTYVSNGGGYLWYEITQPEKYKINIDFQGQL